MKSLMTGGTTLGQPAPTVDAKVPVRAAHAGDVSAKHHAHVRARYVGRAMAYGAHVVETNPPPSAVHRRQWRPRHFLARFFIKRVALGERDYGWILSRRTQRALLHQCGGVVARQAGEGSYFHRTFRS